MILESLSPSSNTGCCSLFGDAHECDGLPQINVLALMSNAARFPHIQAISLQRKMKHNVPTKYVRTLKGI